MIDIVYSSVKYIIYLYCSIGVVQYVDLLKFDNYFI
jgi:hypothetical protein